MCPQENVPTAPDRKRILVFCDYYLPSKQAGGGLWTVSNLVERLSDRFQFFIVTRNHDNRNDLKPFSDVPTGRWVVHGRAEVMYLAPQHLTSKRAALLVNEIQPDCVFLNSVFSKPVVKFLTARRRKLVPALPTIVAPCGELSPGALLQKRVKKWIYYNAAKSFGMYSDVIWKASSESEADEIRNIFGGTLRPLIAPDLPPRQILPKWSVTDKPQKVRGAMKLIFLSRIDRKKNLGFVIERLQDLEGPTIELTIAGPIDDPNYWSECEQKLGDLPRSIQVKVIGPVDYEIGLELLVNNHFIILPTLGENFGYVLLEALAAGTPLIVSNRTPWGQVTENGAGWSISLDRPDEWSDVLSECVNMDNDQFIQMSKNARKLAVEWLTDPAVQLASERVFDTAMESNAA